MSTSAAQKLARQRYKEKNIELVAFEVKKGMSKEYSAAAAELGLGKMEMIRRAIAEFIQRHAGENFHVQTITAQPTEKISPTQRRLLDAVEKLPADAQKSLLKFLESLSKAENTDKPADIP